MSALIRTASRFSVAPMMDWTTRDCRAFHRALSKEALLYTEMVTSAAVVHGDRARLIGFSPVEHPVAQQLGGSDPKELAQAAKICEDFGYDEVNLNVGCPSDRVQSGRFGACLMQEPDLVAECVAAMKAAVKIPVTVKCRIGVDDQDPQEALYALIEACEKVGIDSFTVHARKAWLKGLSPKENRDIPPLDYDLVYRLKADKPHLFISLNGGIKTLDEAEHHLKFVDGVMLGRAAYHEPALMGQVDRRIFGRDVLDVDPFAALAAFKPYLATRLAQGAPLNAMVRHLLGLMHGLPGARAFRRILTVDSIVPGAGLEVVDRAILAVQDAMAAAELRREQERDVG